MLYISLREPDADPGFLISGGADPEQFFFSNKFDPRMRTVLWGKKNSYFN